MQGSLSLLAAAAVSRSTGNAGDGDTATAERRLILRYRAGDQDAFTCFVGRYRAPVYGYLVRCGVAVADRDDLFQEIFLRIHAASATYRAELPVHPWVFTIVANAVRTYQRKRRLRALIFSEHDGREAGSSRAQGENAAAARQTLEWLEREVRTLPRAHREALLLVTVEELSLRDAAAALGLPVNTVKTHLRRARMRLAQRLVEHEAGSNGETP